MPHARRADRLAAHEKNHTLALALVATRCAPAGALAKDAAEEVRQEAREIFQKVISFRTSEGLGQVPAMAQYLAERFRAAGFPEEDIHILPVGETASLVVRYRGNGRGGKPILLLAHMDVVTAKPEEWQRDPFTLDRGERLLLRPRHARQQAGRHGPDDARSCA